MKNKQQYTPVRFSHLTSYSGVGAIVRGVEDRLMVVVDTRYWTDRDGNNAAILIPYVNRITSALGIGKALRMPPVAKEDLFKGVEGSCLPAVLFPTFARCSKCGLLHPNPWKYQEKSLNEKVFCQHQQCQGILKQVAWCCVSNEGHLDEVPWHAICHTKSSAKCEADYRANYLRFGIDKNGKNIVKCTRCGTYHRYEKETLGFINRPQPWIYESVELSENIKINIVEINDSSAYLPDRVSALVIPPESRISKSTVVDKLYSNSTVLRKLENVTIPLKRKGELRRLATQYRCGVEEIESALEQIDRGYPNLDTFESAGGLIVDEYRAFLTPLENVKDDEDFVTEHKTDEWKALATEEMAGDLLALFHIVDRHIVAKRLREILVFKGFKRGSQQEDQVQLLVPPDIVGESSWLPAIELFGEGVFFTFNEIILSKWEQLSGVKQRAIEISERYEKSGLNLGEEVVITPRFILLHTLAHLIIRELESSAGYPAAALSERIYHSKNDKMAGILIYTVVPDVVGSLGGIVESAQPREFVKILNTAFKQALWCSLDPVCTEHRGQGPGWLNRAACHACVLVPETACDYGNVFLDRVFIKGNEALGIPNFLNFVMENK